MDVDFMLIETAWGDRDAAIEIKRDSEEFKEAAQTLSGFINSLNLPSNLHNRLVELTIAPVDAAEASAFSQGFGLGLEYGRYEAAQDGK